MTATADQPARELRIQRASGVAEAEVSAARGRGGSEATLLLFFTDLTERKSLRTRLAFADRMLAVGSLAGGVAHEVNNPLSFMTMTSRSSRGRMERLVAEQQLGVGLDDVLNAIRDVRHGCDRVRRIVKDLRTFSQAEGEGRTLVDLRQILRTCLSLTGERDPPSRAADPDAGSRAARVREPFQITQEFLNLLLNAAQAIEAGDAYHQEIEVTLDTRRAASAPRSAIRAPAFQRTSSRTLDRASRRSRWGPGPDWGCPSRTA